MQRALLVAALVASFFASSSDARAQDCSCVSSSGLLRASFSSSFLPELPAPLSGGFSAAPEPRSVGVAPSHAMGEPLWCEDSDDPRCAPMHQSERSPSVPSVPAPVSQTTSPFSVAPPTATRAPFESPQAERARAEHRRRLDRPPKH
ncbi:MAG: hypothetical protein GXP55_03990 [Deltaproteobacteria bacterium]|nr:hypothetical protein [Deltaproteobacteria bacterium]